MNKNKQEFDEFYTVEDSVLENRNDEFISSTEMLKLLADALKSNRRL